MQENSILGRIEFDPSRGALLLSGSRYLLIRPETFIGFQKELEKEVGAGKAGSLLYSGGFEGGSRTTERLFKKEGHTAEGTLKAMCEMGTQIGWGAFDVMSYDGSKKSFEVSVRSSVYAQAYGPSPVPVCHLISGVLGGVAAVIFGDSIEVAEVSCAASGADSCHFATGTMGNR